MNLAYGWEFFLGKHYVWAGNNEHQQKHQKVLGPAEYLISSYDTIKLVRCVTVGITFTHFPPGQLYKSDRVLCESSEVLAH